MGSSHCAFSICCELVVFFFWFTVRNTIIYQYSCFIVISQFISSNLQNDAINNLWSRAGLKPRARLPKIGELGTEFPGTELWVLVRRGCPEDKCPGRGEFGWIGGKSGIKPTDGLLPKIWPTSILVIKVKTHSQYVEKLLQEIFIN